MQVDQRAVTARSWPGMDCQSTYPACWQDFSALAGVTDAYADEFNASLEISS